VTLNTSSFDLFAVIYQACTSTHQW